MPCLRFFGLRGPSLLMESAAPLEVSAREAEQPLPDGPDQVLDLGREKIVTVAAYRSLGLGLIRHELAHEVVDGHGGARGGAGVDRGRQRTALRRKGLPAACA